LKISKMMVPTPPSPETTAAKPYELQEPPPVYLSNYDADYNSVHPDSLPPAYPTRSSTFGQEHDAGVGGFTGTGTFTRAVIPTTISRDAALLRSEEVYDIWFRQTKWLRATVLIMGGVCLVFEIVLLVSFYKGSVQTTISLVWFFFAVCVGSSLAQSYILLIPSPFARCRAERISRFNPFSLFHRRRESSIQAPPLEMTSMPSETLSETLPGTFPPDAPTRIESAPLQLYEAAMPLIAAMRVDAIFLIMFIMGGFIGPNCLNAASLCFLSSTSRWLSWINALLLFITVFSDARGVKMLRESWTA
jgi:hypothetical protein